MTRIEWNQPGSAIFEAGVDRGVFYPRVGVGVPWNGLVSVDAGSSGGEHTPYYYDGVKYLDFMSAETFEGVIEAISAPPEFEACDGSRRLSPGLYAGQQPRETFSFAYRSRISSDLNENLGYKLHLIYNATASPTSRSYSTLTRTPSAPTRSWTIHTVPPKTADTVNYKPTAYFVVDSRDVTEGTFANFENYLYGTSHTDPHLPTQQQVINILSDVL